MVSKLILGTQPWVSLAVEMWNAVSPGISYTIHEISIDPEYNFSFDFLDVYSPTETTGFVAWGNEFLNFQRWELVGALKSRGFKMPALIHPSAIITNRNNLGENSWIMPQVILSPDVVIGLNSIIGSATIIGPGTFIKNNVSIGSRCSLGHNCLIESHTILGDGVNIGDRVVIGKYAIRERSCRIDENVSEKSFCLLQGLLSGSIIDYG